MKALNPLAAGFGFLLLLFCGVQSARAAITFDNSSSSAAAAGARSIPWRHAIGSGPDRALVVAVAIDDFIVCNGDIATVKFNNVVMPVAPNSHAVALGLRVRETQISSLRPFASSAVGLSVLILRHCLSRSPVF